ncbi:protein-L-isoaspartate(D-aspartate) O-methyltransferase [Streptomyces ferrugineus]|uniref:Protein-L-isoaspartate O-methyltransferase n=1 Tax=Streptomyces ferrugineus TaxID=1413221 RepID=A0A7M2SQZ4_9ACTN|nr:methyltransferase domain-containing protein [Streptomyces ferrugineus]QOV38135.1 protein-L-isoaspartate(D-aspartate) O-methyltransferase [Streptomyces ferrugineus]
MTNTTDGGRAQTLADRLAASGQLTAPWRAVYEAVPRHLFVPDVAWAVPDGPEPGYAIDRDQDAARWWDAVYSDTSIVTQIDDGAGDLRTGKGTPSCSCSAPGIVFSSLDVLDVHAHHRVLEIGTGTGWTASLLSCRVGERNVVSVEVDAQVAAQADKNITAAAYAPRLIVGDGAEGGLDGAPYDRVHATCAVGTIPYAWVEQTRPGGVIVAPWEPLYGPGQLARLVVDGDGRAVGRFPGFASYMMLRSQRHTTLWAPHHTEAARQATTRLDPRAVAIGPYAADLVVGALVPGVARIPAPADDGSGAFSLLLVEADQDDGAWAAADYAPGEPEYRVTWHGTRNLWQEVEDAYLTWVSWGQPDRDRLGMTVTPESQHLWLDHPDHRLTSI